MTDVIIALHWKAKQGQPPVSMYHTTKENCTFVYSIHKNLISLNATTFNTNIGGSENRMNHVLQAYQKIIPDLYLYFLGLFFDPSLTFDFFLSRYHLFYFSQFSVMSTKSCTMDIY